MAENKTKPTSQSPAEFLSNVNDQRRKDGRRLLSLMKDLTGESPKMWGPSIIGFGQYHYKYGREGDSPITGFSPRKQNLVLYLGPGIDNPALLARLGKHKKGKGCLYINKLDDVDHSVLRELVMTSIEEMNRRTG